MSNTIGSFIAKGKNNKEYEERFYLLENILIDTGKFGMLARVMVRDDGKTKMWTLIVPSEKILKKLATIVAKDERLGSALVGQYIAMGNYSVENNIDREVMTIRTQLYGHVLIAKEINQTKKTINVSDVVLTQIASTDNGAVYVMDNSFDKFWLEENSELVASAIESQKERDFERQGVRRSRKGGMSGRGLYDDVISDMVGDIFNDYNLTFEPNDRWMTIANDLLGFLYKENLLDIPRLVPYYAEPKSFVYSVLGFSAPEIRYKGITREFLSDWRSSDIYLGKYPKASMNFTYLGSNVALFATTSEPMVDEVIKAVREIRRARTTEDKSKAYDAFYNMYDNAKNSLTTVFALKNFKKYERAFEDVKKMIAIDYYKFLIENTEDHDSIRIIIPPLFGRNKLEDSLKKMFEPEETIFSIEEKKKLLGKFLYDDYIFGFIPRKRRLRDVDSFINSLF